MARPQMASITELRHIRLLDLVRRSSDWAREQIADPALQNLVGRQPDRVFNPLRLQKLVDLGHCKGRVRSKIEAWGLALVARHDGLEHVVPAVSAVHVAATQSTAFEVAKLVEHQQRVIAGAGVNGHSRRSSPARRRSGSRLNPCRARATGWPSGRAQGAWTCKTPLKSVGATARRRAGATARRHHPNPAGVTGQMWLGII